MSLNNFRQSFTGDDKPDWRDLHSNVVSQYAVHWEAIGAELGLKHHHIANILEDHQNRIEKACSAMMRKWLDMGSSPTWGTLDDAIDKIMKEKKSTTLSKGDCKDGGGMWTLVKLYNFTGNT